MAAEPIAEPDERPADPTRRLNHWVPASYLASFTRDRTSDGLLTAYRRDSPNRAIELPPRALAKERDLYVVPDPDGGLDDSIERMLADYIEGPFLPVRNALVYGRSVGITSELRPDQEAALAMFIAFQHVRTPKFRERFNVLAAFGGNLIVRGNLRDLERARRDYARATGQDVSSEYMQELREDLETGRLVVEPNDKLWLGHSLKLALEARSVIQSQPSRLFRSGGIQLPTSDNPVVIVRRIGEEEYLHGGGILQENVEIVFPLAPDTVLVMGNALRRFQDQGTPEWYEQVRHRIATGSDQWLFSPVPDEVAAQAMWSNPAPMYVVEYPGGRLEPGQSAYEAVRDMMDKNPSGGAIIRFGPAD